MLQSTAVKSCPLVNDCNLLAVFYDFYLPSDFLNDVDPLGAIGFIFGLGKLEWLGYNLVKVA